MAGGHRKKSGRYYVRARAGNGARIEVRMLGVTTDAQADVRADQIARVVGALARAGRADLTKRFATELGAATTEARAKAIVEAAAKVAASNVARPQVLSGVTFAEFAKLLTDGDLEKKYPDHVRTTSEAQKRKDAGILTNYVNPKIGTMPLGAAPIRNRVPPVWPHPGRACRRRDGAIPVVGRA